MWAPFPRVPAPLHYWFRRSGLSDAFCKNTGHFDLSTVPGLSYVVFRKRHRENRKTISIVLQLPQLQLPCVLADSLHFGVCVACQPHQGLPQQQQICIVNFAERTLLTSFTTWVNISWEILRYFLLKLRKIIYFQNTGFRNRFSKYRPFTGLCSAADLRCWKATCSPTQDIPPHWP